MNSFERKVSSADNKNIFRGWFDNVYDRKPNSVRVFISSTFSDTIEERDSLIKDVYPKLQDYCLQTYNIQFQYFDLRWGIQDQAIYDHSTVSMCLQELDQCCRFSLATNCVILLSHRYGWRALPTCIRSSMMNMFKVVLSMEDNTFIDQAYVLDENLLEPVYVLRAIDPEKREEWEIIEQELGPILRRASDICLQNKTITLAERNEFHISVTTKEIFRALENNALDPQRIVSFFRDIEDMDQLDLKVKSKFIDTDQETEILLNQTKQIIREKLPLENQFNYQIKWKDISSRENYLSKFQNDFYTIIKQQIDYYMTKVQAKDILYDEIVEHAIQCQMLNQNYFPRNEILEKVKQFVLSDISQPCLLFGKSGTGKSSIMAQIAIKIREWFPNPNSVSVIIRFLGATPLSNDIRRPLISIIQQICIIYQLDLSSPINDLTTIEQLKQILQNLFIQIPTNEQMILLFDSIDQLQFQDYNCEKWLPINYPSNIKFILSTIPTIIEYEYPNRKVEHKIVDGVKSLFPDCISIEITEFDVNLSQKIFDSWLKSDGRCLTPLQMSWLQPKLEKHIPLAHVADPEPTPLYLSLIYEMTQKWRSFDDQPDYNFLRIKTTKDAIDYLYNHLSQKHGKVLFKRALGYLIRAGGLSDIELEDILSADNTVMQSVFVHYLPPTNIFRLPSFLWIRIRNDMHKYFVQKQIDNTIITYFYHRSFQRHDLFNVSQAKPLEINRCSYFAGPVGNYPHLYNQPFVIQSQKLIDKMGGISSLVVDRCLTKQQPYIYSMRRINQLCLGLEFIWCEPCFLYDYHFMFNYLHCYKMSDKFLSDSYFPQIRFLLTQYKTCSNILDKYPKNFPFEIVCRLSYLIDILPEYTYNLFQQCLNNCKLRMLESDTKTFYPIMNKYQIGLVNVIDVGYRTLHLLLSDKLITFRYYTKDWIGKILEYNLPSNKFTSFKCGRIYYCFYSTKSILVIGIWDHQLMLDLNFDNLIHLDFIYQEELFVCLQDNQSMNIYNCLDKTLIEEYLFDSPILQCSTIERYMELSIRVTLQNGLSHYFIITNPQQQNRFQLIATLDKQLEKENIFLNFEIDVYYSQGQSHLYLYHFQRPENDRLQKIDNLPLLNNFIYRQSFYTNQHESALIWLTNNSILIFHSCQNYFLIPGQYDELQTKFYQMNRNFIACLNRNQSIIEIYEWKLQEIIHTYRLLVRLEIDQQVSHWTFQIDTEWGIIVYCTLENGELRKYNTTIRNYLPDRTTITHSNNSIDYFEIQNNFVITLDKTKCILNLFTFVDRLSLFMQLRVYNAISQLTLITSYLLLLNSENILFIYSIDSTSQLLYETNEFENHSVKVYSLGSSFFIIDAQLGQLFRIDTEYPFELHNVAYFNFICHSLLSVVVHQQDKLFILSDDHSMLAIWNAHQRTIEFIPLLIDKNVQIREIFVLDMILIFYDNDQRTHLWNIENQQNILTLDHQFSKTNNNCLYFIKHIENKCLIYDVKKRLFNEIQLEMSCDVFCFTEDGKYLFGISEKESLLLMYQVDNHQLVEKLFIENLLPHIQISKDRLILMNSNNEILLLSIIEKDLLSLKRDTVGPSKSCALFENADWLDCHKDECWTTTNSLCNYQNPQ